MRTLALVLILLLSLACEDGGDGGGRVSQVPPEQSPTTVATPSRSIPLPEVSGADDLPPPVEARPVMTAGVPSAPPAEGLLGTLTDTDEVKVTRLEGGTDTLIKEKDKLEPLLQAIGLKQKVADACPSGLVAITLTFKDRFGTRLATLGLFQDGDKLKPEAALRDGAGANCHTVKLAHPDKLNGLIRP